MTKTHEELLSDLSITAYGITIEQAHAKLICIECKELALNKCYSDDGKKEYGLSGLCEQCFDTLFEEEEE
jgi:hypothetical protein